MPMIAMVGTCGALSRMNDVCDLSYGHRDVWHVAHFPRGGWAEWQLDHTFPCDCGNCHNSQPSVAEKGGD